MNHSVLTWNPNGGADDRRAFTQPTLHDDLMVRVVAPENLESAWKQVKANRGAPGVDGMSIDAFPAFAQEHGSALRQALLEGTYQPAPVRRATAPKPGGRGERMLGIPTVLDRRVGQAMSQVLTPMSDPDFPESRLRATSL